MCNLFVKTYMIKNIKILTLGCEIFSIEIRLTWKSLSKSSPILLSCSILNPTAILANAANLYTLFSWKCNRHVQGNTD